MVSMVSNKSKHSSDMLNAQCFTNETFPSLSNNLFCLDIGGMSFYYGKIELEFKMCTQLQTVRGTHSHVCAPGQRHTHSLTASDYAINVRDLARGNSGMESTGVRWGGMGMGGC